MDILYLNIQGFLLYKNIYQKIIIEDEAFYGCNKLKNFIFIGENITI